MARIRTLLLTGTNNHDWTRSSPFCRDLLEGTGRFDVEVTETPAAVLADAEAIAGVQLFFFDWNEKGENVGATARANFEDAVRNGAGVCILHAADNGFRGWRGLEEMVGLMWRDGTGHGAYQPLEVKIVDREHPITRGQEDFSTWDELYHRLVHLHDADVRVLATAYSDPEKGGTGNDEPVMIVSQWGGGRIYHHVLGHVWRPGPEGDNPGAAMRSFENEGFQRTLLRGCEWAATGEATLLERD